MTLKRANEDGENCQTPPSKRSKMTNSPARNFKDSWKSGNAWLRYDSKLKVMFCDICLKAQKTNSFTSGCTIMKKENVTKHSQNKGMILIYMNY